MLALSLVKLKLAYRDTSPRVQRSSIWDEDRSKDWKLSSAEQVLSFFKELGLGNLVCAPE